MRSTLLEVSLWLVLAGGALQTRAAQRHIKDEQELFQVEEARILREIAAYSKQDSGDAQGAAQIFSRETPSRRQGFEPAMGLY